MGNVFGKNKEYRILMVGLDAAGKTTIMYKLKLGEIVTTIPTIGFNVETIVSNNVSLCMWDIGMRIKSRPLMRHYFPNTQALILVVDSNDRERMDEVKEMIDDFLTEDELRDVSIAVLCNKQDILSAMSVPEITEHLQLYKLNRTCGVFPTCGTTGEGLEDALKWLTDTLTGQMTDLLLPSTSLNTNTSVDSDTSHSVSDYLWKGWQSIRSIFVT